MKISLNWIRQFVDIPSSYSGEELGRLLTLKTAEVEEVIDQSKSLDKIVVGEILKIESHPDADKLQICRVSDGDAEYQVVCGASNIYEGMKAPLALIGAKVRWHGEGDLVEIKKTKVRGVPSDGMLCAGSEIGVEDENPMGIVDVTKSDVVVGSPFAEVAGMNDVVLDIDNKSLTHRPDLWSHYGFARELAAILKLDLKPYVVNVDFPEVGDQLKVEIESPEICPRFVGCLIKGVKVGDSPVWMKERLNAAGVRSVSNIVDVTNYVMLEYGQPMHAYDRRTVGTDRLIVRKAKKGEQLEAIDHKKRELSDADVTIENGKEILTVAGVMGGAKSEISDQTTEVIIEAANWDPVMIRQTSVRLGLRTDSSARFEKSLDPEMCLIAVQKAAELILKLCPGAEICGPVTDEGGWSFESPIVDVDLATIQKKIGVEVAESEVKEILEGLRFEISDFKNGVFTVKIPSWRATKDVDMKDDLIEEVARIYGYDKIPAKLPVLPACLPVENRERVLKHKARQIFSQILGFNETMNYSFYGKEDLEAALLSETGHLQIENFLSEDQTHLRTSLVPNMLKSVAKNVNFSDELKIYEVGRTYADDGEFFPREEKWICGAIAVNKKIAQPIFYEAKANLEFFLERFNTPKYRLSQTEKVPCYAHPVRCASLLAKNKEFARVFEIHPQVARNFGLDKWEVALFEINFTELTKIGQMQKAYQALPKFPGIDIDVSVVLERKHRVADVQKVIKGAKQKHNLDLNIKNVELFDIYEGENIPEGKKALAFRVHLQADDRTLTSEEMTTAQQKIFIELQTLGGEVRGAS